LIAMPEPGPLVRPLGPDDSGALAALEAAVFHDPWDAGRFRELLGQDRFFAAGAFDGPALGAYLTGYMVAGELEIVNVAVAAELRGRGLGSRLLRFCLDEARRRGAVRAVLEVRSGNAAARALYKSCGFAQAGLRRGYYADSGEDALVLEWTARGVD
jgi:ribosomal-protein-alanine N-acetyltransferase